MALSGVVTEPVAAASAVDSAGAAGAQPAAARAAPAAEAPAIVAAFFIQCRRSIVLPVRDDVGADSCS